MAQASWPKQAVTASQIARTGSGMQTTNLGISYIIPDVLCVHGAAKVTRTLSRHTRLLLLLRASHWESPQKHRAGGGIARWSARMSGSSPWTCTSLPPASSRWGSPPELLFPSPPLDLSPSCHAACCERGWSEAPSISASRSRTIWYFGLVSGELPRGF